MHTQVCQYLNQAAPGAGGAVNCPQHAAQELARYAVDAANSPDNVSVVVASFRSTPPPLPQRPRRFGRGAGKTT